MPSDNPISDALARYASDQIPKAPWQSRLVWALAVLGVAVVSRALFLWGLLPPTLGKWVLQAWQSEELSALIATIAVGGLAVEVRGRQQARSRELGRVQREVRRHLRRGYIAVELASIMAVLGAALALQGLLGRALQHLLRALGLSLGVLALVGTVGLLGGCGSQAAQLQRCRLVLRDHPHKPAPAAEVALDCDGVQLRWLADSLITDQDKRCPDGPAAP